MLACDAHDASDDVLRREILKLAFEDDIPLWEVADHCRTSGVIGPGSAGVDVLAAALLELARTGEIRVRVGPRDDPELRDADLVALVGLRNSRVRIWVPDAVWQDPSHHAGRPRGRDHLPTRDAEAGMLIERQIGGVSMPS